MLLKSKAELHLFFNQYHSPVADSFFLFLTYFGDGLMALFLFIILLFIRYRYALIFSVSSILSAIITHLMKNGFPSDRPIKYFTDKAQLYLVQGSEMNFHNSFPSGHTVTAFAIYFALALFTDNKLFKTLLFILALLVGYSRVYLSQHFFQDIYVGSIIGTLTSFTAYYYLQNSNWLNSKEWADSSLSGFKRVKGS